MNERIIGKCSICGGTVTIPTVWWSTVPPTPTCSRCGAVKDVTANLPTVPMKPMHRYSTSSPAGGEYHCRAITPAVEARMSLAEYDRLHDNGCSICRDPNCDNPGGKH